MQHFPLATDRSAQDDEPVLDQGIHETRVLIKAVLLAQITRPVPGPTALETDREVHG